MQYFTVDDVEQLLERRRETIDEWLAEGRLPSWRLQGRVVVPGVALWPYRQVSEDE
jgi:excisionase family DNA binding protein